MNKPIGVFATYDKKAGAFGQPMFAPKVGVAIRILEEVVSTPEAMLCKCPDDFALYQLGDYDPNSGQIEAMRQPQFVCEIRQIQDDVMVKRSGGFRVVGSLAKATSEQLSDLRSALKQLDETGSVTTEVR